MDVKTRITKGHSIGIITVSIFLIVFSILCQFIFSQLLNKKDKEFIGTDFRAFYHVTAVSIADGNGILNSFYGLQNSKDDENENNKIEINHPPGYPIFIALCYKVSDFIKFERVGFLKTVETIIYGLSAVVMFLIFSMFFSSRDSIFGSVLWIINPLNLWLTRQPHSEIPFFLVFSLSLFFFFRMRLEKNYLNVIFFSIFVATTIFLRSAAILLPVVCLLVAVSYKKSSDEHSYSLRKKIGLFVLPYLLIAPWVTFISLEHKSFVPMTSSGQGMIYNGLTYLLRADEEELIRAPDEVKQLIIRIGETINAEDFNNKQESVEAVIFQSLLSEPYTAMKLMYLKLVKSTHSTFSKRDEIKIFLFNFLFLGLACYSCFLIQRNIYFNFSIAFFLYSIILCVVTFPLVRYNLPALGLFSIYVSVSLRKLIDHLIKRIEKS